MAISQMVGASIKRREDPRLVTGTGRYVDDLSQTAVASAIAAVAAEQRGYDGP